MMPLMCRAGVELHVTSREFAVLQDWLHADPGHDTDTMRAWLIETGREPSDFEYRSIKLVVDSWRTK